MAKRKNNKKKSQKPRLSLCMIARNEAAFLERCLASVRGLVDEVVIVDTGSEDDTPGIVRRHGGRLLRHAWDGDFSVARNVGLAAARGEWILVLDCDEELAEGDHAALRAAMAGSASAYYLTTRNYVREMDRSGFVLCRGEYGALEKDYPGWFPSTKVRLWRRRPAVRFEGAVHELVESALLEGGIEIADCPVPVHHYGYAEKERPTELYLQAGEEKVRRDPDDLLARYELALAYRNAGHYGEGLQSIDVVVEGLGRDRPVHLQEELVWLVRGELLDRLGRTDDAEANYREVLRRFPASYQAHNNLGSLLERGGRRTEALEEYRQAAAHAPENPVVQKNLRRLQGGGGAYALSVCIIARDEEAVLGRCLESVAAVADQVVVVDTGSSDATVDIARAHGAEIGRFAWCDDFAAARNASLDLARGDWVLWLDADDYLEPAQAERVRELKAQTPQKAFYFTLANEGADNSRFRQIKMFPRRAEVRFERPVHESVLASLEKAAIPVEDSGIEVRHTGYATHEQVDQKKAFYLELMRRRLQSHPEDHYVRFRVGHTLYTNRDFVGARRYLQPLVEAGEAVRPLTVRRLAAVFYGRCFLEEGEPAQAEPQLRRAHALQEDGVLANLSLGDALVKLGRYAEALPLLQAALGGRYDMSFPLDEGLIAYSALFFSAQCHEALGRRQAALDALSQAEQLAPGRDEALQMRIHLESERVPEAVAGRPRLSLCMIVRDEEQRLGRCLDSVQGLVDEIVVVDTGSRDATVEVARRYGARLGHFDWCDDFSAARNVSLEMARGEWILWLDADDLLPAEGHATIRQLMERGADKGYFFVLDDDGYENVSCLQMRLFPNVGGVRFEMPIHEQVTPSLARAGIEMVPTQIRVVHTGYTTPEVVRAKKDRYLRIMEQWLKGHPGDYLVRSHVALTYHSTGRLEEALEQYRLILQESDCLKDRNYVVYTTALLFTGRTYLKLERYDEALEFVNRALEVDPDYLLSRLSLAEVHGRLGHADETIEAASAVLDAGTQLTFFPVDQQEIAYSARVLRAKAFELKGDIAAAESDFRAAAAVETPRRAEALGSLAMLYKQSGRLPEAERALQEAAGLEPDSMRHLFNLGVLHLEQGRLDEAEAFFRQVTQKDPAYAPAWLNLGLVAKGRGRMDEAEGIYRRLLAEDPGHVDAGANLGHLLWGGERFAEAAEAFAGVRRFKGDLLDVNLGYLAATSATGTFDTDLAAQVCALFPELASGPGDWDSPAAAAAVCGRLAAVVDGRGLPQVAELARWCQVNLAPDDVEAQRLLGETLVARGEYWKAVGRFEAVLLRRPREGEAFRRLGDCYRALGAEEAARQCYDQGQLAEG